MISWYSVIGQVCIIYNLIHNSSALYIYMPLNFNRRISLHLIILIGFYFEINVFENIILLLSFMDIDMKLLQWNYWQRTNYKVIIIM